MWCGGCGGAASASKRGRDFPQKGYDESVKVVKDGRKGRAGVLKDVESGAVTMIAKKVFDETGRATTVILLLIGRVSGH